MYGSLTRVMEDFVDDAEDAFCDMVNEETANAFKFMDASVDSCLISNNRDDDAASLRDSVEHHRVHVEAVFMLKTALECMKNYQNTTNTFLMMPRHPYDGLFERALPVAKLKILEDLVGGMQQVADSCPVTLKALVKAGKEQFSFTECNGCGAELGSAQCMSCAHSDDPRRPETVEEEKERRERPLYM